jgi:hypothetical protein
MLHIFAMVFKYFSGVFASVSESHLFQVFHIFFMLQLLYLDISKVDQVLHIGCAWEEAGGTDDVWGDVGDVRGSARDHYWCTSSRA